MRDEITWIEDGSTRRTYLAMLGRIALGDCRLSQKPPPWRPEACFEHPEMFQQRLKDAVVNRWTYPVWWRLHQALGVTLPKRYRYKFPTARAAIDHALQLPTHGSGDAMLPSCFTPVEAHQINPLPISPASACTY
jgi:hypothetical protein